MVRDFGSVSEAYDVRRIAMERFGLKVDSRDDTLYRLVKLAGLFINATATAFTIPVRSGTAILAGYGIDFHQSCTGSPGCSAVIKNSQPVVLSHLTAEFNMESPALAKLAVRSYLGLPAFNRDKQLIGVLSLFFDRESEIPDRETLDTLNDYVRLIEEYLTLRTLSIRDPLTQLFNRRYLDEQSSLEWRRAMRLHVPLSFALIDIDWFKSFNDTLGHKAGDRILICLARSLEESFKRAGDSICRYGGEEFALILPMTTKEQSISLVDEFRVKMYRQNIPNPGRNNEPLSISAGIETINTPEELENNSIEECFIHTDSALYKSKAGGRNRTTHYADIDEHSRQNGKTAHLNGHERRRMR